MVYKGLRRAKNALEKSGYTVEVETVHRVIPLKDDGKEKKAVEEYKAIVILDLPDRILDMIPTGKGEVIQMEAYRHLIGKDVYKITRKDIAVPERGMMYVRTRRIHGLPYVILFSERILTSVYD
jgi:hypothetical protein